MHEGANLSPNILQDFVINFVISIDFRPGSQIQKDAATTTTGIVIGYPPSWLSGSLRVARL